MSTTTPVYLDLNHINGISDINSNYNTLFYNITGTNLTDYSISNNLIFVYTNNTYINFIQNCTGTVILVGGGGGGGSSIGNAGGGGGGGGGIVILKNYNFTTGTYTFSIGSGGAGGTTGGNTFFTGGDTNTYTANGGIGGTGGGTGGTGGGGGTGGTGGTGETGGTGGGGTNGNGGTGLLPYLLNLKINNNTYIYGGGGGGGSQSNTGGSGSNGVYISNTNKAGGGGGGGILNSTTNLTGGATTGGPNIGGYGGPNTGGGGGGGGGSSGGAGGNGGSGGSGIVILILNPQKVLSSLSLFGPLTLYSSLQVGITQITTSSSNITLSIPLPTILLLNTTTQTTTIYFPISGVPDGTLIYIKNIPGQTGFNFTPSSSPTSYIINYSSLTSFTYSASYVVYNNKYYLIDYAST